MRTIDEIISGSEPRPVIISHRGASHYHHENTMEAFEAAVDMCAEMIEFDVRRTFDGVLVVHHDLDFAGREIKAMSINQIKEAAQTAGYSIPTLLEVLRFCADKIPVDIELKEAGYEDQVLETVLGILVPDQFIITSVNDSVIRKIKDIKPEVRTGLILSSHPRWQLITKLYPEHRALRAGADVLVVSQKLLKVGFLSTTRNLSLPVWIYTVNDRRELWRMIKEKRISGFFTDRPDVGLLLRDLHAAGQKSEPGIQDPE
ncbi:MAG: glycerophosphodiester phosphodiesterase [bacterium]|nr:glycerophosphodiester phosphodiesterase [bacterium]MDT8367076.1 glycerophosphodiester phosphodiesterase [bacterium]